MSGIDVFRLYEELKDCILSEEQSDDPIRHRAIDTINGFPPSREHSPSFLQTFLLAFLKADPGNYDLLRPVAEQILNNYEYHCTCKAKI